MLLWGSHGGRLCTALILAALAANAQVASTIQGQTSDSSGASVPKASIRATNLQTGVARSTNTGSDGFYRITDLLPGRYEIRAEAPGFKISVHNDVDLSGHTVIGLNIQLEVGNVTESVNVSATEIQVETQEVRISTLLTEKEVKDLPVQGRGVTQLALLGPGITGRAGRTGNYCCDVFSNFAGQEISSGGNERKEQYYLDGITLRYSEGSSWSTAFSPNPDAVAEVRVNTDPHSAEMGRISGPQVQIVSKGGTNEWHGTGHFTVQDDALNARPYFSRSVPDSHYRLFGGTIGGPVIRDRLFAFGAYEGLRSQVAGGFTSTVETEQFRDSVARERPNSIAAALLRAHQPLRYPTERLQDVGRVLPGRGFSRDPDGIPDIGQITVDSPFRRWGNQVNARVDYHFPNAKDRLYASYWYTKPNWGSNVTRPNFLLDTSTRTNWGNFVHTRTFSPSVLNEARFAAMDIFFDQSYAKFSEIVNTPGIDTDDGLSIPMPFENIYHSRVYQIADTLSFSRGRHAFRIGADYRRSLLTARWPNPPTFLFGSILDFADDSPYEESRTIDTATGAPDPVTLMPMYTGDFSIFIQNTWQIRRNLTLNYGIRWETFFPIWIQDRANAQPVMRSSEVTDPTRIAQVTNQLVDRLYDRDLNNFGPRLSLAWDPSGSGRMVLRAGFGVLYDETSTFPLYQTYNNPPGLAVLSAGPQHGSRITYALAPPGTRDFPVNPDLRAPRLTSRGGVEGALARVAGIVTDLQAPRILSFKTGMQYQLSGDMLAQLNYSYRKTTNDLYSITNINRYAGDVVDGRLDGFTPEFGAIRMLTNRGDKAYHGLSANLTKRFSRGFSVNGSYTYNHGKNNDGDNNPYPDYSAGETDPVNPSLDYARDDIPHVFTLHSVWELPVFRSGGSAVHRVLGGWQLNAIANLQSGGAFVPISTAAYGNGGDFNADGVRSDRPDAPAGDVPSSFSKSEWLRGPLSPSMFPLPSASAPRAGTLPRDYFRGPGYANVDVGLMKAFALAFGGRERGRVQLRAEAFNIFNRVNLSNVERRLNNAQFGFPTSAAQNRVLQISAKYMF